MAKTPYEIRRNWLRTQNIRSLLSSLEAQGDGIAADARITKAAIANIEEPSVKDIDLEKLLRDLQDAQDHIGYVLGELRERLSER
jgi:hypothetical protein